ncbi:Clp amino terminal domain-containing protein, pathogenicity island component [Klenkia marina]|uniref:Clp amino terminal domain-containing protein, pathogenicity island component n=1 Tax=Klenkia marina TaxID=1960309 RepID=A0A1G4YY80_9ACTN|nr:Clp protease N-terminal domain-containing protein [Klenkia marina]SCX58410.1 Clp amino terminal domain-containing protein, pathogenicity island component [Klenkia marina]
MTSPVRLDHLIETVEQMHPDPLDRLGGAVAIGERLGEVADHLVGHFVDEARRAGLSWTQIGAGMGVTKQAAQKRFVPKEGSNPFERFSEPARRAVIGAQETARGARAGEIGTDHLLVALLDDDGVREQLRALDVDPAQAQELARARCGTGTGEPPALIPFDSPTKAALERAARTDDATITPGHLLLAVLVGEPADGVLTGLGLDRARLAAALS